LANGGDHVERGAITLTAAACRQTHLAVDTANPVDQEYYSPVGKIGYTRRLEK
jgi:hypothetical protein